MKKYLSLVPLLLLPVLVLIVIAQMPTPTGSPIDAGPDNIVSNNDIAAPIVLDVKRTMTETSKYRVTNLSDTDPASVRHEFYDEGYPGGSKTGEFSETLDASEAKVYSLGELGPIVPQGFDGSVVLSSTQAISASVLEVSPSSYMPLTRLDPTPTATPTPVKPEGTGIFKRLCDDEGNCVAYKSDSSTSFWGQLYDVEGNKLTGPLVIDGEQYAVFTKVCWDSGSCDVTNKGHDFGDGGIVFWIDANRKIEDEGTVQLFKSPYPPGVKDDIVDDEPVSRKFQIDTENGTTFAMSFQVCAAGDTSYDCSPNEWDSLSVQSATAQDNVIIFDTHEKLLDWIGLDPR